MAEHQFKIHSGDKLVYFQSRNTFNRGCVKIKDNITTCDFRLLLQHIWYQAFLDCLIIEDGTERLYWNDGMELQIYTVWSPKKSADLIELLL